MRFLLDTNILIPLEDSSHVLELSLANFDRQATLETLSQECAQAA